MDKQNIIATKSTNNGNLPRISSGDPWGYHIRPTSSLVRRTSVEDVVQTLSPRNQVFISSNFMICMHVQTLLRNVKMLQQIN